MALGVARQQVLRGREVEAGYSYAWMLLTLAKVVNDANCRLLLCPIFNLPLPSMTDSGRH